MAEASGEVTFRTMQTQADADAFRTLNEEWIVKLFRMEENDRRTLGDPWGSIVAPGGQVYLAGIGDRTIGCAALAPLGQGVFELAKMAVTPEARGQGLGRKLLSHVLQQARLLRGRAVVLGSSTQLQNAVHLYESLGFQHVAAADLPIHYERATVWMKLEL